MPQSYKHKQHSRHKHISVRKGYPEQELLLSVVGVCFKLVLATEWVCWCMEYVYACGNVRIQQRGLTDLEWKTPCSINEIFIAIMRSEKSSDQYETMAARV